MDIEAVQNALFIIDQADIESVDDLLAFDIPNTITHNKEYHVPEIDKLSDDPAAVNILCTKLILKKLDKFSE